MSLEADCDKKRSCSLTDLTLSQKVTFKQSNEPIYKKINYITHCNQIPKGPVKLKHINSKRLNLPNQISILNEENSNCGEIFQECGKKWKEIFESSKIRKAFESSKPIQTKIKDLNNHFDICFPRSCQPAAIQLKDKSKAISSVQLNLSSPNLLDENLKRENQRLKLKISVLDRRSIEFEKEILSKTQNFRNTFNSVVMKSSNDRHLLPNHFLQVQEKPSHSMMKRLKFVVNQRKLDKYEDWKIKRKQIILDSSKPKLNLSIIMSKLHQSEFEVPDKLQSISTIDKQNGYSNREDPVFRIIKKL